MISAEVINRIYKRHKRLPKTIDALNLPLLNNVAELHDIIIDETSLTIGSIDNKSPFHSLLLKHIHGIENFENQVAIVLRASIIFLDKKEAKIDIHIKAIKRPSVLQMLIAKLLNK